LKVLDTETNTPVLKDKQYFYDELKQKIVNRINELFNDYVNDDFVKSNKENVIDLLGSLKDFIERLFNDKLVRKLSRA
jgi:hypothetical protein